MDATTIVLLLITLVSAFVAIVWACKAERRIDDVEAKFSSLKSLCTSALQRHRGAIEMLQDQSDIHSDKIAAIALTASEIKARLVMEKTAKELIAGVRQELAALQGQVAGMQVSREVLTEPEFVDRVKSVPLKKVADLAYVDGGHAACDEQPNVRRVRSSDELDALAELVRGSMQPRATDFNLTAPDADPETAEAQPQPDDDQATAVNDVQAVEEWDEAKRGEVA